MKKNKEINLGYVIDRVMKANGWDQTALGKRVGATQGMVSRMRKGVDWEQHWQIFMKLLPLAVELNIINPNILRATSDNEMTKKECAGEAKSLQSQDNLAEKEEPRTPFMSTGNYQSLYLQ